MRLLRFDAVTVGRRVDDYGSNFVLSPLVRTTDARGLFQVACFQLEAGNVVGFHAATVPQLFAVVSGSGWVTGEDRRRVPIGAFEAAFWDRGEWHESGTDEAMTVIVIEGESVAPHRAMLELVR
jgi:hypothetical protein